MLVPARFLTARKTPTLRRPNPPPHKFTLWCLQGGVILQDGPMRFPFMESSLVFSQTIRFTNQSARPPPRDRYRLSLFEEHPTLFKVFCRKVPLSGGSILNEILSIPIAPEKVVCSSCHPFGRTSTSTPHFFFPPFQAVRTCSER